MTGVKCIGKCFVSVAWILAGALCLTGCSLFEPDPVVTEYETQTYNKNIYRDHLFAEDLCVPDGNVEMTGAPDTSGLHAAALFDVEQAQTDFSYQVYDRLFPASTTKIMTALVALETLEEIGAGQDSRVTVPDEAAGLEGSSVYLKAGQQVTMEELLYGMMLQSGNDAAAAVAICCGGDMETFVEKMNDKAAALGCGSTHFTNPSGLHDEGHYTTARDLAIIGAAAMEREDFRRIVSAESWQSQDTGRSYVNKNKTLFQYDGGNGIKIGYTKASGRTLAASAERDGKVLIAVVLNDHNWFEDAYEMLDYGFEAAG